MAKEVKITGYFEWRNNKSMVEWVAKKEGRCIMVYKQKWWERLFIWLHLMKDKRYDGSKVNPMNRDECGMMADPSKYFMGIDPYEPLQKAHSIAEEKSYGNVIGFDCVICGRQQYKTPLYELPKDCICDVCREKI